MSPRTIVTGSCIEHNRDCKLEFDPYAQIHGQQDNSLFPHTSGAIALRLTINAQETRYFLNID